jgi:hypothetical protein
MCKYVLSHDALNKYAPFVSYLSISKFSIPNSAVHLEFLQGVEYVVVLFYMPVSFTALYQFLSLHVD